MRLPRNLSGPELAALLSRHYGYTVVRQRGSHMRLSSDYRGFEHHVTIPRHSALRVGTLNDILGDVSAYLEIDQDRLATHLFGE